MAKIDLNSTQALLERWYEENQEHFINPDRKTYGNSLFKWLYSKGFIIVKKERRADLL